MNSKKEVQHVYLVGAKSLGAYGGYETFVCALPLCGYRTGISDSCKGSSSIKMLYVGAVYFSSGDWCVLE